MSSDDDDQRSSDAEELEASSSAADDSDASSDVPYASRVASKRPAAVASKRPAVASKRPAMASKRPATGSKRPATASKKMPSKRPVTADQSSSEEDSEEDRSEEEEEEEEDDSEEEQPARPAKRRKGGKSQFIDDVAEVGDDDDDDDEEGGVGDLQREMDERQAARTARDKRPSAILTQEQEAAEMERLAAEVHQRYGYDDEELDEDEEDYEDGHDEPTSNRDGGRRAPQPSSRRRSSLQQRNLNPLPSIRDPKLWLLKCKPGMEQSVICELMTRCYTRMSTPSDALFIKTAFMTTPGAGYFYVEAEKEVHVQKAIVNLRFVNTRKIVLVPIKEMVRAISIQKKRVTFKRGQWVRMKRGVYKGDLGQVLATGDQHTQVTVKLIPRLDYTKLGSYDKQGQFQAKARPPARLLNPSELRDMGESLDRRQEPFTGTECLFFAGNYYKYGFIYKNVKVGGLIIDGVSPTLSEVEKFQSRVTEGSDDEDNANDEEADLILATKTMSSIGHVDDTHQFSKGNSVKVVEGDLKHLTGVVLSVVGDQVTIMPAHEDLHDPITFPLADLRKYFKLGDHVKVVRGEYKDETGLIVAVENVDDIVVVFSDISSREMRVFATDLIESSEVSAGRDTLGNYELHDLVAVRESVGIIVKVEIGSFQVLDTKGIVQTIRLQDIGRRRNNRMSVALDVNNRQIAAGDAVKVTHGPNISVTGTVVHIFRSFVFMRSRELLDQGGIFVVRARSVSLVGEHNASMGGPRAVSTSATNPVNMPTLPAFARGRRPQGHSMLNQTVTIKTGQYKGLMGIVKDANDAFSRVELHSQSKVVNVATSNLVVRSGGQSSSLSSGFSFSGAQTPLIGGQTPSWGGSSRTPMHGAQTPLHHPNTPSYEAAWNANSSLANPSTPLDADTPTWGGTSHLTPSSAATTPFGSFDAPVDHPATPITPSTPFGVYTPTTPSLSYISTPSANPSTPTPFAPQTPVTVSTPYATLLSDWVAEGLQVLIDDGTTPAVIISLSPGQVIVQLDGGAQESRLISDVQPHPPAKNDRLMIIAGENQSQTGTLLGLDGSDGIVKMDSLDINIIEMSSLCRLP